MIKKFAIFALLIIFCSILAPAQYVPSNDEYSLKMNDRKKSAKKKRKISRDFAPNILNLDFFLPAAKDSWALSLTYSGGFAGVTRLAAAVNSNGNFLCSPDHEFRNRLLEKDVLDEIFDFVETTDFSKFEAGGGNEALNYCMDCAAATLTLQTKDGFVSRPLNNFENETAAFIQIYDRLNGLEECR